MSLPICLHCQHWHANRGHTGECRRIPGIRAPRNYSSTCADHKANPPMTTFRTNIEIRNAARKPHDQN